MTLNLINDILPVYNQPGRFYHNFQHIAKMYADLNRYESMLDISLQDLTNLQVAIAFHDYVHHPIAEENSNEHLSANAMRTMASTKEDEFNFDIDVVELMILATEFHFNAQELSSLISQRQDLHYVIGILLDLDILGFASDYDEFLITNKNIIKEYSYAFPKALVTAKHRDFLTNILDKELLTFRSLPDADILEEVAYDNIEKYIRSV